jgi:hypothetical protein
MLVKIADFYGVSGLFRTQKSLSSPSPEPLPDNRETALETLRSNYKYQKDISELHLTTIKELVNDEETRHISIETKISNVITQAGLVFSITAVIAPFFNDTISSQKLGIKIVVLIIFVLSFSAYVTSILFATQILGINKFVYKKTSLASVIDSGATYEDIIAKRIKDLIYQNRENKEVNNKKADILIYANRWFVSGFILSGLLTVLITVSLIFIDKPNEREKEQAQLINSLDIRLRNAESGLTQQQFLTFKTKDSLNHRNVLQIFERNRDEFDSVRIELKKLKALIHKPVVP